MTPPRLRAAGWPTPALRRPTDPRAPVLRAAVLRSAVRLATLPLAALLLATVLLATVLLAGCGPAPPVGFVLPPAPPAGELLPAGDPAAVLAAAGVDTGAAAAWGAVEMDHETRPVLLTTAAGWRWHGRVPPAGRLRLGVGAAADAWRLAERLDVEVVLRDGDSRHVLQVGSLTAPDAGDEGSAAPTAAGLPRSPPPSPPWFDLDLDLAAHAGEVVTLEVRAAFDAPSAELAGRPLVAWGPARLAPPPQAVVRAAPPERPNVLLVVVDTLRADHLTSYGYPRDTAPRIDELLARRGVVLEQAWSQAPWTLPSVVSFLTGRYPGELLTDDKIEYGIPPGAPSLAERFRRLGYRTAGFIANPTMHAGNGFARGFETFYTPDAKVSSLRLHGDTITTRAVPWLRDHAGEPFFAYVHFVDPHDPYLSPGVEATGITPFDPDYTGTVSGEWPHGLFTGQLELPDPQRDLRHLEALYDSEVRFVDGQVGHLLDALPPAVLADTLVVLTADHGEELFDHGWWKHGLTVFQEQLHVPFVVRWDRRLPAGRRVAAPVELVDLVPTLLAAVGEPPPPAADGSDLLPLLAGGPPADSRHADFAQHLAGGPLRAAVRLGDWKLALFDRQARYEPENALQRTHYRVALGRLARVALYNLADDPGERHDAAGEHPRIVERLAPLLVRQLDAQGRPGLRLALAAAPAGVRVAGEVRFERPPEGWASDFLAAGDRVELDGAVLRFDWESEGWPKGIRVLGEPGAVELLRASLDGAEVAPARLRVGDAPWTGRPAAAAALVADGWPPGVALTRAGRGDAAGAAVLALWQPAAVAAKAPADDAMAAETARRLRALGYIQ